MALVSDDPCGPFEPWPDVDLTPKEMRCLDGSLYTEKHLIRKALSGFFSQHVD